MTDPALGSKQCHSGLFLWFIHLDFNEIDIVDT